MKNNVIRIDATGVLEQFSGKAHGLIISNL